MAKAIGNTRISKVTLLVVVLSGLAYATSLALPRAIGADDDEGVTRRSNDPSDAASQFTDIRVIARAARNITRPGIQEKFGLAILSKPTDQLTVSSRIASDDKLKELESIKNAIAVEEISEADFYAGQRLFGGLIGPSIVGTHIKRNVDNPDEWVISLASTIGELQSLAVKYEDGTDFEIFTPVPRFGDNDAPLRVKNDEGEYIFVSEPGRKPEKYKLNVKGKEAIAGEWPINKYFTLFISQFQGKLPDLWDALASEKDVANPLKDLRGQRAFVAIADFEKQNADPSTIWKDNVVTVNFPRPVGTSVDRVWMLFPLTKEEATRVITESKDTAVGIAKGIGSGTFAGFESDLAVVGEPTQVSGNDSTKAKWFEIPGENVKPGDQPQVFKRAFDVTDRNAWVKDVAERSWQVVCYQQKTTGGIVVIVELDEGLLAARGESGWSKGPQRSP